MINFHETRMGQKFFEYDVPKLIKELENFNKKQYVNRKVYNYKTKKHYTFEQYIKNKDYTISAILVDENGDITTADICDCKFIN